MAEPRVSSTATSLSPLRNTYFIDIDGTIARTAGADYGGAVPIRSRIERVNALYDDGHIVVYWTARGTLSGVNWYDVTKSQLEEWGAKHHELRMGKPAFDVLVDDKAMSDSAFFI